ncbi:hypothetical protein PENSPDRAFT_736687 [Peniophora sp. CONT]|nr:hypothetical protein PENSPDRAFT_736687 [Peniophora sp. CONT]
MRSLPTELLLATFNILIDEWPFTPWDVTVQCAECSEARPRWSLRYKACIVPSLTHDGTSRKACQTMRLGWVNLTHVCSAWRGILINMPALWTTITEYMSPDCVHALSARSKDQLLDVSWLNIAKKFKNDEAMAHVAQSAHSRIHRLATSDDVINLYAEAFTDHPLSSLQSLTLHVGRNVTAAVILPLQAHDLSELVLHAKPCSATMSFFAIPGLRKLSIHFQNGDGMDPDVLEQLLGSLSLLESLEELYLDELVRHNGFEVSWDDIIDPSVNLSQCSVLELQGDQLIVDSILCATTISPHACLRLSGSIENPHLGPSVIGTCYALDRVTEPSAAPFLSASLRIDTKWFWGMVAEQWTLTAARRSFDDSDRTKGADFTVIWDKDLKDTHDTALGDICASFASSVRDLSFTQSNAAPSAPPHLYHVCFSSWSLVERLRVTGSVAAHSVVDALLSSRTNEGTDDDQLIFPRLRVLEFIDVKWEDAIDEGRVLGEKLSKTLQERYETGSQLEVLVVPDLEALKALVWWKALQDIACVEQAAYTDTVASL